MDNEEITSKCYDFVKKNTSNGDIYFGGHVLPIASECKKYARDFQANSFIAELGGLFHDIGYSDKIEKISNEHIINGINITLNYLKILNIGEDYLNRIVDCIRTHDGHLNENSPIENILVNDIDALVFLQYPQTGINLLRRFGFEDKEIYGKLEMHAEETLGVIRLPHFKYLAKVEYNSFLEKLKNLKNDTKL